MADNIDKILERDGVVDLCLALQSLKPGAQWILRGDNYSGLEWIDDKAVIPSEDELKDEIVRLEARKEAISYRGKRASEYPQVREQLDMLYHDKVNSTETWKVAIKKVKDKYPKT